MIQVTKEGCVTFSVDVGKEDPADDYNVRKGKLIIKHIDAQSIQSNFDEIKMCAYSRDIDALCISETSLQPGTRDVHVNIPNYVLFRNYAGRVAVSVFMVRKS